MVSVDIYGEKTHRLVSQSHTCLLDTSFWYVSPSNGAVIFPMRPIQASLSVQFPGQHSMHESTRTPPFLLHSSLIQYEIMAVTPLEYLPSSSMDPPTNAFALIKSPSSYSQRTMVAYQESSLSHHRVVKGILVNYTPDRSLSLKYFQWLSSKLRI